MLLIRSTYEVQVAVADPHALPGSAFGVVAENLFWLQAKACLCIHIDTYCYDLAIVEKVVMFAGDAELGATYAESVHAEIKSLQLGSLRACQVF